MSSNIEEVVDFATGYDSLDHKSPNMASNTSSEDSSSLKEKFKHKV